MSGPVVVPFGTPFGPYRVLRELGRGGMGIVYLAEIAGDVDRLDLPNPAGTGDGGGAATPAASDGAAEPASHEIPTEDLLLLPPGTRVAIKTFHPHLVQTSDFARRFRREARVGAAIHHLNVVRTIDAGTAPLLGTPTNYLAMEFVEGQTIRDLVREMGRVPDELTRTIARQIAAGLAAIHAAGITHRDMKPENVILTKDHRVKIMDLGVAKVREESIRLSLTGQFLGSIHYASPEQFRAPESVDMRTDLYALGVLVYEMLAGENPFFHDDLRVVLRRTLTEVPRRLSVIVPEVSPFLDQLTASLMAKDPAARIQSAATVLDVFERGEESDWWRDLGRAAWTSSAGRVVRRMPVAREAPLAGREEELKTLRAAFDAAASGSRRVVLVEGEAGVGKTRVIDEFAAALAESGAPCQFLFGTAPQPGTGRPFHAYSEALLQAIEPRDPTEALTELLPKGAPAAEFAAVVTGAANASMPVERARSFFAAAFRALAAKTPLLLVIDDLHLAGENSATLLSYLAHDDRTTPILVVAAFRPPDETHPLHKIVHGAREPNVQPLPLARLGPKDVATLIRSLVHSERLVQELGFRLLEKTEGNPFFILEVLRSLQQEGVLSQRNDGGWTLAGTRVEIHVPDTVRDVLQNTLSRLTDEERDLLDVAAVIGQEFDPEVLAEATGTPKLGLLKKLSVLERRHRLIRAVGRRCRFDHPQLRETLYEQLMEGLREEYHAQIGDIVERRYGAHRPASTPVPGTLAPSAAVAGKVGDAAAVEGAVALDLARHFVFGGRPDRAARWIRVALRHAEDLYRTEDVIAVGRRFAESADEEAAPPAMRASIMLHVAQAYEHEGRQQENADTLSAARLAAEASGDPRLRRLVLDRLLVLAFARGDHDEAVSLCRDSLRLASRTKDRDGALAALANLAAACRAAGRFEAAVKALNRALRFVVHAQSELRRLIVITQLVQVEAQRGRGRTAQRYFAEAIELAKPLGVVPPGDAGDLRPPERDELRDQFTGLSRALGRYAETRADGERTLLLGQGQTRRQREGAALLTLGLVADHVGQNAVARSLLLGAGRAAKEAKDGRLEGAVLHALGENAIVARAALHARKWFEEALAVRRKIGYRPGVCETLLALGQIAALGGQVEVARASLEEATELAPALQMPGIAALAHATAALLAAREGRRDEARNELEAARNALDAPGPLSVTSRVEGMYFAALAAKALGDDEGAAQRFARAWEILERVAAHMPPDERRVFLTETSPHREIAAAVGAKG